ncbi:MAG TPA: DUF1003 domain-containing protein [Nevskiaceae bacterium]|nr:DUF1003 domain-containing protein [Nevskiaceae bacterium]
MAINANKEIRRLKRLEDHLADAITSFAGTMRFVYLHIFWFGVWIAANLGLFGAATVFDDFPFGLLTLIVSLEAIFLSTFVMISQNRQARASEIRSELDYQTDIKAEKEIDVIMKTLERVAKKQGVDIHDLLVELHEARKLPGIQRKEFDSHGHQPTKNAQKR